MAFIESDVGYFRFYNGLFAFINVALLVACVVVYFQVKNDFKPYYQIQLTSGQVLNVYLLFISLTMHSCSLFMHLVFTIWAQFIVNVMREFHTNPYRWIMQLVGDGNAIVGIMAIYGIQHIETVAVVVILYASVLVLCYYQDEYLNPRYEFLPGKEPHVFAVPIYLCLVIFVAIKSTENVNGDFVNRINMVSLFSLFQSSAMFLIQRLHIFKQNKVIETAEDVEEDANEKLETQVSETKRALFYETIQYVNSAVFQLVVTWLIISITKNNVILGQANP